MRGKEISPLEAVGLYQYFRFSAPVTTITGMQHHLTFSMDAVPDVAKRDRHALILLRNPKGKFLLGAKDIYPPNIYRIIGGGIEAGEEAAPAAVRELEEETGLKVSVDQLKHLATITADIDEPRSGKHYTFVTELFFTDVGNNILKPSDDIQGLQELSADEVSALIDRYYQLPQQIDGNFGFSWNDYGQLYGMIHQIALDELQKRETL